MPQQIAIEAKRWYNAKEFDHPRGTVLYVYFGKSIDFDSITKDTLRILKSIADSYKVKSIPLLVVILYDYEGKLG